MDTLYGYCHCGCGQRTSIAPYNRSARNWIKGAPVRFLPHHDLRLHEVGPRNGSWKGGIYQDKRGYTHVYQGVKRYTYYHILLGEHALGHALPKNAVVHHYLSFGLVICPNQRYHLLLHRRMRALDACGNAAWRKCQICKQWDEPKKLYVSPDNWTIYHRECQHNRYLDARRETWKRKSN